MARSSKPSDDDYGIGLIGSEPIGVVLRRWAKQSAQQLHDDYKMQHIYPVAEVYPGWFAENARRKKLSRFEDTWYSTGRSYQLADDIRIEGDMLPYLKVLFHTTMGAIYAEAGVGLTGRKYTRGSRSRKGRKRIKVQRKINYSSKSRYADWHPMSGQTHRPSTRHQVNLFRRRLSWMAKQMYLINATAFLHYELVEALSTPIPKTAKRQGEIVIKPTKAQQIESIANWIRAYPLGK